MDVLIPEKPCKKLGHNIAGSSTVLLLEATGRRGVVRPVPGVYDDFPQQEADFVAKRNHVILDAMIPREDFGLLEKATDIEQSTIFNIRMLFKDDPFAKLLRKPDFQRETNHWSPKQIATFLQSYVEGDVIPSLILWSSQVKFFVIDGGHRLSALRAWVEDDYGDRHLSSSFYAGKQIPQQQLDIGDATRKLVEKNMGRFATMRSQLDSSDPKLVAQAKRVFDRTLYLQWVKGDPEKAETSFFKINTQGTPLDATEQKLIRHRRTPIAISARAIVRAGTGHKYWSRFEAALQDKIMEHSAKIHKLILEPEPAAPITTLDLPLAGDKSLVNTLDVLIQVTTALFACYPFKNVEAVRQHFNRGGSVFVIQVLANRLRIVLSFSSGFSLGLHPIVYFYSTQGEHQSYLFLGIVRLFTEKVIDNDAAWFKKFTVCRKTIEDFLIANKETLLLMAANMSQTQRVKYAHDLFAHLVDSVHHGNKPELQDLFLTLKLNAEIFKFTNQQVNADVSDAAKSIVWIQKELPNAMRCSLCHGLIDRKAHSFDHQKKAEHDGTGHSSNLDVTHPYCNSIRDWLETEGAKIASK